LVQAWQRVALAVVLKVPALQGAQTRSVVALPFNAAYSPGAQALHLAQELALLSVLNVPGSQGAQA
jgi:hypothetical protein